MKKWNKVSFNSNLIQTETEKAFLIKLPKSKFKFWHPKKLCKVSGKNDYLITISYPSDYKFSCFRNGEGRYNFKEKTGEMELTVEEFEEYFINH